MFIYYSDRVIKTWWIRLLSIVVGGGETKPVHCKFYFFDNGIWWMTELTSDKPEKGVDVVGVGDGYMIQKRKVNYPEGKPIAFDNLKVTNPQMIHSFVDSYASVKNGNLTSSNEERCFCDSPQGYGGPEYGRYTSNTYVSWLLGKTCYSLPPRPKGAVGWGECPQFPCEV
jgi:hypothetical protein